jgi:hypothetical protein
MKVVPIGSRLAIFPSTVTVAPPLMVTPFAMTSSALRVVAVCLEVIEIGPAGLKCKGALDSECCLLSRARSWGERSGSAASADRGGAADATRAAERAAGHLHGAAAGGAPGAVRGDESAAADCRGAGVTARAKEKDDALPFEL